MSARYRFKLRQGTTAQWTTADPVLLAGEPGVDIVAGTLKLGDGVTPWSDLEPIGGGLDEAAVQALIDTAIEALPVVVDTNGAPDVAATQVDLTGSWANLFTGFGTFDLGTGGSSALRYVRQGRLVFCQLRVELTADHATGIMVLPEGALPYRALNALFAAPSGFTYAQIIESESGAGDGYLLPLAPNIAAFGPGNDGLAFAQMTMSPTDGQLGNLWQTSGAGVTPDITGRPASIFGAFVYEAEGPLS